MFVTGCLVPPKTPPPRANAAFVVLARNKELEGVIQSVKSIERHFNRWFHYPYVFLNDGDFNSTFKETIQNYTSAPVEYGRINGSMWGYPDWVDHNVAKEGIKKQGDAAIMYGGMESYHHMCRFYSGYVIQVFSIQYIIILTRISASSINMNCSRSTSGIGDWSQRSSTFVILPSKPYRKYLLAALLT